MELNKFTTTITDDHVRLHLPIQKIDEERRLVSGFATLDNVDKHGDIITAEASLKAFSGFRGNIREMHMPKAVGKMVNFEEKTYYDPDTQKDYRGIYVEVYVSKGAQDTWEKVLDQTLSGFSIGGNINPEAVEKNEEGARVIDGYELFELSLVDNPANQFSNVFSIQKLEDGSFSYEGFAVDDETTDAEELEVQKAHTDLQAEQPEQEDDSRIDRLVARLESIIKTIGGNTMTTQTEETAVEEVETQTEEVVEDVVVEKAADVSEVEVETPSADVDGLVETVVERVLESLEKRVDTHDEVVEEDAVEATTDTTAVTTDLSGIEKSLVESNEALASAIAAINDLTKTVSELKDENNTRLEALEDASAVRKSVATGKTTLRKTDSDFWGESALGGTKTSA